MERSLKVSVITLPEAAESSVSGMCDSLGIFNLLHGLDEAVRHPSPFDIRVVAPEAGMKNRTTGFDLHCHATLDQVRQCDIVILPAVLVEDAAAILGRYPALTRWLKQMHDAGAEICAACSGTLLLAETGLLDGRKATVHWAFEADFAHRFPAIDLRIRETLVVSGERGEFVMSGASASWHDLVLYLVARHVSPEAAQSVARFLLLQWHPDGQGPYIAFREITDHGDAVVREAQRWLRNNLHVENPVEDMIQRSGLAGRTFSRRFRRATGHTPIKYTQGLRVERAKRWLERTGEPVDEVAWSVGYEDPAFFRRLFKRTTGITPAAYRRKLQLPGHIASRAPTDSLSSEARA